MEGREKKPRVKVDLKTVLLWLGILGLPTVGSVYLAAQRGAVFLLAATFESYARADSARALRMIQKNTDSTNETIFMYMDSRFNRLESIVIRIPGAMRPISESERARIHADSLRMEKERFFPTPPFRRLSR